MRRPSFYLPSRHFEHSTAETVGRLPFFAAAPEVLLVSSVYTISDRYAGALISQETDHPGKGLCLLEQIGMEERINTCGHECETRTTQALYLRSLLSRRRISAREIARLSRDLAQECGKAELAVGHQAVSGWVNGTRHPTLEHRQVLSKLLNVPFEELNRACEADGDVLTCWAIFTFATIVVHGEFQTYEYTLMMRRDIDVTRPAIYQKWTDMFSSPPGSLTRHLRHITNKLFGWIPDQAASPMVHYPQCLVPIEEVSGHDGLRLLDPAISNQKRVWFVYLPDGHLHVGIGCREGRYFSFAKNSRKGIVVQRYPLSRVELVGYVTGNTLFHMAMEPNKKKPSRGSILRMPNKAI